MKSIITLVAVLLLSISTNLHAQYTDLINSNRPGVSRSAFAVGTNVLQFELGPNLVNEDHSLLQYEVKGFSLDFAVRYGLFLEQLEIILEGSYQNDTFTDKRSSIDLEDKRRNFRTATLGAKYLVYDPYKSAEEEKPNLYSYHANRGFKWKYLIPAVSVTAGVNVDSKNNPYTAPGVEGFSPFVIIATQHNFTGGWVFVMNFLKDRIGTDQSDFQYILTLTKSVGQQWAVFGEAQGIQSDFYADNLFRLGGAYLWSPNFQLDTHVTFNTKDTPTVFNVGLGASYRLDWHQDPESDTEQDMIAKRLKKNNRKNKKNKKKRKKNNDFLDDDGL